MVGGDATSLRAGDPHPDDASRARPSIYYGDEIGMTGELDPLNRGAFPWDQPRALGSRPAGDDDRGDGPAPRPAGPAPRLVRGRRRGRAGHRLRARGRTRASRIVAVNAGDAPRDLSIDLAWLDGRSFTTQRWAGQPSGPWPDRATVADGRLALSLPPRDGAVLLVA